MKNLLTAALIVLTTTASARAQPLNPTQEYRIWSAERMIERVTNRLARLTAACGQPQLQKFAPKISETCKESIIKLYPALNIIREVAASGDDLKWATAIGIVHKLEADTETPLNVMERKGL